MFKTKTETYFIMQVDKDGIITILIGLILFGVAWAAEAYLSGGTLWTTLLYTLKDMIIGGIAGIGVLLVIVGILFITAW